MRRKPARDPNAPRTLHLYKGQLLVARLSNTPGEVVPTVSTETGRKSEPSAYCSGQLFSAEWEPDIKRALAMCQNFEELVRRLKLVKYRIEEQSPTFKKRPFFRL